MGSQMSLGRVLVIDDDPAVLETFLAILSPPRNASDRLMGMAGMASAREQDRFEVTACTQGEEGVALAAEAIEQGQPYELILTDMRMPPGIDGLETATRLRQIDPRVYLGIVTAYADHSADEICRTLEYGVLLLRKPFTREEILQMARTLCRAWQTDRRLEHIQEDLEADVAERTAGLERSVRRLRQAASVFESTADGVLITDAAGDITAVNKAFCDITGYSEAEVLGRNPRMLASGRHDKAFYQAMWQSIRDAGRWSGEVWNRRKDGRIFPEWLSVSAVYADDGRLESYVATFSDLTQAKDTQSMLDKLVHYDALTGLPNRVLLDVQLDSALERAERRSLGFTLLQIDLDAYKSISDSLGHGGADELVRQAGQRLSACVPEAEARARLVAGTFVVGALIGDGAEAARELAERIAGAFLAPFVIDGEEVRSTISIGIAMFPHDADSSDGLLGSANTAMHQARTAGGGRFAFFEQALTDAARRRLALEARLRRAIEQHELKLLYQPQVELATGRIVGVEALVRWVHPELGVISPADFIPLAEETGLIVPMGEWILDTACAQAAHWNAAGPRPVTIAVNISAVQLATDEYEAKVSHALDACRLPNGSIELEITESLLIGNPARTKRILENFGRVGTSLAIDDFGTGYSSLGYLREYPLDKLKIDKIFVDEVLFNPEAADLARTIIAMGRNLRMRVLAEGVESVAQASWLKREGCDDVQGFVFSRPVEPDEIEQMLQSDRRLTLVDDDPRRASVIVLLDRDPSARARLAKRLTALGPEIVAVGSESEAWEVLATYSVAMVIAEQPMGQGGGLAFLEQARRLHPRVARVLLSDSESFSLAQDAINRAAVSKLLRRNLSDQHLIAALRETLAGVEALAVVEHDEGAG